MPHKDVECSIGGNVGGLKINEFDLNQFCSNPSIAMVAKRGSGKSVLVRAILNFYRKVPVGCIISPTDRENKFYGDFVPESYIYYEYNSKIVEKIMVRQRIMKEKARKKKAEGKKIDTRCYIVMDDCLASKGKWINDPCLKTIFFNGRHSDIMYIMTMQFPLGITPELRGNIDYVFLLADDSFSNKKRIFDHYAGMFPSFDAFRQVFDKLTEDFTSMVIVNRGIKKVLTDKIFWYKAENTEISRYIGHKQFVDFDKNNYNPTWDKDQHEVDADEYFLRKKKEKGKIFVSKINKFNKSDDKK